MPDGRGPSPPRAASPTAPLLAERKVDEAEQARQNNAQRLGLEVFKASIDLAGTIALSYLTRPKSEGGRAVDVPEGVSGRVLRFSPRCPWRSEANELVYVPALIGLFCDIHTDEPKAILRRALTADGRKVGKPRYLGPTAGCAIKLTANEDVCQSLHVGEGVETMLAAMMLGFAPAWALGGTGNLQAFPILVGVDALTIVVDHDRNGAGQVAASECFDRWTAAGREVWCVMPKDVGMDMNDVAGEDQ
jgi:putative DNA primase/helicase